ncbi:hypothetical protein [Methylosarcina fibrata]|uniref:hypothetical protein n=1 Tax=Methylosarcina fibrata TaxID=105972 RepID=UPI00037FCA5A|nr:hypothetical protein [Methylosarcina fibrata]
MWIFLTDSFLSIVDKGDDSGKTLLVRARRAGDIEKVFPDAKIQVGVGTDYLFRARIDREKVANAIAESARSINYSNFKSKVTDHERHDAYMDCWSAMYAYQRE